jgi:hypothetical protein
VRELESTYKELKVIYDQLNDVEKADEGGKALAASLETLKQRAQEAKAQLDTASKSLNDNGQSAQQSGGILEALAGKFTLNTTNNPNGLTGLTFSAHVPSGNTTTLSSTKKWWTDATYATEGSAADPIADLIAMVEAAQEKGIEGHFEVNKTYLSKILGHSKVVAAIGANLFPTATNSSAAAAYLSRAKKLEVLAEIVGAPFVEIDAKVATEVWNKTNKALERKTIDAFEANVVVFVPNGEIGEILTVEPIAIDGGTYATFYGGRLLMTVDVDAKYKCQSFNTEMTSLVVANRAHEMLYLKPNA